ncbi:RNase A-like domain-containing protein [Actinomadura logoneensis]|uniref:RNase A-like domain-containing protein n=1 Tax=Actinomadura logoneensis TaxID=2293572 RepID=UPI0011C0F099|nr:RNase A-like domain-containing protein [Actinomadura logoneensis]
MSDNNDMAGKDYGGEFFGTRYDPVAHQIVIVWEKLVMALGGVSEGLTVTANNFVTADWHSKHGTGAVAGTRPVPQFRDFTYRRPAPASGSGYMDMSSLGGQLVIDMAFGEILKAFPRGHPDRLNQAAAQWTQAASAVSALSVEVNRILNTITIDSDAVGKRGITADTVTTWQKQMQVFCSRIWGKAPWDRGSSSNAPLHVLGDASNKLASMCRHHAEATVQTREALKQRVGPEIFDLIADLASKEGAVAITAALAGVFEPGLLIECGRVIITKYIQPINGFQEAQDMAGLLKLLEHASMRVPTLQAMEAQSESVGDRAMHDFNYPGLRGTDEHGKGSQGRPTPPDGVPFPIDLAGQEGGPGKSHVIDKHVGKTDEQLQHRLDSEPPSKSRSSSTFESLADARKYVQEAINSPEGERKIRRMIERGSQSTEFLYDAHEPVGRSLDRNGNISHPTKIRLRIHLAPPGVEPRFYVNTAYPEA